MGSVCRLLAPHCIYFNYIKFGLISGIPPFTGYDVECMSLTEATEGIRRVWGLANC